MLPYLIDLGTVELPLFGEVDLFLPTYGVLFALGVLVAWWWFSKRALSLGLPADKIFNLCFYTLLGGIVGAKLLLIMIDLRYYLSNPSEILGTIRSAGVLVGGVAVGAAAFVFYARRHDLPVLRLGDAMVAPLALSQSVGRLGCFSAGCCYGVHAKPGNPFAIAFTDPNATVHTGVPLNVPLVPTQLIQLTNDLLLAVVLTWLWRRRPEPPGTVFWLYLLLYGLSRGIIEFWRGDTERGLFLGGFLSTTQLFSIVAVLVAAYLLLRGRSRSALAAAE